MGGGKGTYENATEAGAYAQYLSAKMAEELFKQTAPLRASQVGEWGGIAGGNMPYEQVWNTILSAARRPVEEQYGRARENIMATVPTGGRMYENLADVETERAGMMGSIGAQYLQDALNKMYGAAWQTPQVSIGGLGNVMSYGTGAMQAAEQGGANRANFCCFNFLEAEGEIYSTVRRYRDDHYLKSGHVSKGYVRSAVILVPLMRKYYWFKQIVRYMMTRPLKQYSRWYYGESKFGFVFYPFKLFWVNSWRILGVR